MRSPADELIEEHRLIRRMLSVLESLAGHVEGSATFPAEDVATTLRFFREFVERIHHAKETECCYPSAVLDGHEEVVEAVGSLAGDHESSRNLLHGLMLFWEPEELLEEERSGFAELARTYSRRLRAHMDEEESTLYPTVRSRLAGRELERLLERFDEIEGEVGEKGLAGWSAACACLEERWAGPRRDPDHG